MPTMISEPVSGARAGSDFRLAGRPPDEEVARPSPGARLPGARLPSVRLLHRQRVTDLISKALVNRVTVVRGPGGCGKTVACAMWAAARSDCERLAWVDLDPADREPGRLWRKVHAALAADRDAEIKLPEPSDSEFPLRLAELSHGLDQPVTLIIDNVAELAGSGVLAGLDLLVKHGAPGLKLLLAGRHLAGLGLARLQVGGEVTEIGAADLACTPEEASDYFAMLGFDLPAEQLGDVLMRTDGWITGLRLMAMRAPGNGNIRGDDPLVADYLRDEVLDGIPAGEREFMRTTCVADLVCADLGEVLSCRSDAAAVLDRLGRENAMITIAANEESGTTWYRYHPLLLDLLRSEIRQERPGDVTRLTALAARWQASHGQHGAALRNAVQAGDWDLASAVLAEAGPHLLLPGPAAGLEPVLATFPASRYCGDAAVAGALAAAGLRTGDSCATQLHLDNAAAALPDCPAGQRPLVSSWLEALRLIHAAGLGDTDPATIERAAALAAQAGPRPGATASTRQLGCSGPRSASPP